MCARVRVYLFSIGKRFPLNISDKNAGRPPHYSDFEAFALGIFLCSGASTVIMHRVAAFWAEPEYCMPAIACQLYPTTPARKRVGKRPIHTRKRDPTCLGSYDHTAGRAFYYAEFEGSFLSLFLCDGGSRMTTHTLAIPWTEPEDRIPTAASRLHPTALVRQKVEKRLY